MFQSERIGIEMEQKRKYFMFNKALDFKRCFLQNMSYEHGKLNTKAESGKQSSAMISRVLDSQEIDMEWHQFIIGIHNIGNPSYEISIYAANSLERQINGTEQNIESVLLDRSMALQEKKTILQPYLQKKVNNTKDILLHDVKGRYLWFMVETVLQIDQKLEIEKIKVYFPRQSWISYLPEIYQCEDKNQFFERFLAVFQTMYEEFNDKIKQIPCFLDVDYADKAFLEWLAKWLDIAESYVWSKEQLQELLKNAVDLYKIRGTRQAVKEFVKIYTKDAEPYIVENFQVNRCKTKENEALLEHLYGNNPYRFQVIIKEEYVPTVTEYQALVKIIEEVKPAYMELELIVLKPYIFLSQHTYMGMNSVLGEYKGMSLDGASMVSFSVLGDQNAVIK